MKQIFGLAILFTFIACNQSEKKSAGRTDSIQSDTLSKNNQVSIKDKKKEDIWPFLEALRVKSEERGFNDDILEQILNEK